MKHFGLFIVSILDIACSSDPLLSPDMVEVLGGSSAFQRMEAGATVLKTLADEGLPDISCNGAAELTPRCEDAVTPYELLVQVVHTEDMSHVYVQCRVSDNSKHPDLMSICMRRVREELSK